MVNAFETAFANAPIGMALVDIDGHFLQVNDALCRMTGYTRDQIRVVSFRELSHPSNVDVDAPQMQALLDGDLASYQIEKRYVHAWGHSLWVLLTVSLVRDNQGQPLYLISQLQDISERKELERRLEYLVDHDFLTALFNRRRLEQALVRETKLERGTPLGTGRAEMNEVLLASRALVEQVRLVLRDGRRLIRRLIAVCTTSKSSRRVQMTSGPAPLASVPLVVLRSTTDREQIELNDLVQSLSAEGYQVAPRGHQWVVYTQIADRRKSVIGESPQDSKGITAMSERVRSGSLRQRRRDDSGIASAAPLRS